MPAKSFFLPAPLNALAIEISGVSRPSLHSIKITTTDGNKPTDGTQSSNTRSFSSTTGTSNVDWANSHVKFYDANPPAMNSTTIVTMPLLSFSFDNRYLTQDADGESWSMTSAVNLEFYFGSNLNSSYMRFINNGNLSYNKVSTGTHPFQDWGANGYAGYAVPGGWAELNTLKFRTQNNLDAYLLSTSQKRTVIFTELSATDYAQTLGGQLLRSKYGMVTSLNTGNLLVDEFTLSSSVTFDEMSVLLGASDYLNRATSAIFTYEIHNVSLASFTPTRTPEISATVPLSAYVFNGDIDVGYALFAKLASSQTLTAGTYCFAIRASSAISEIVIQLAGLAATNTLKSYNNNVLANPQPTQNNKLGFIFSRLTAGNTNPTNITLSSATIQENSPALTVIGSLSVTDAENSPQTYSLVAGTGDTDNAFFEISGSNLRLKSGTSLDYESKNSYSVRIKATDSADATYFYEKAFTISVTNANEAPTNITLSSSSVAENQSSGTTIGTLSTTDPDASNTFTYSLGGTDASSFSITGNALKTAEVFNYEAKSSYSINITATDQGGLTYTKAFTISVTNVNEAPINITLSASTIEENNSVNAVIGTLSATDPDTGDTSFTFAITGGADQAKFNISGNNLRASQAFNYEVPNDTNLDNIYVVQVTATDSGGLTYAKSFNITVTNSVADDSPTNVGISAASIAENNAVNAVIGTLSATDPSNGTCTFSLLGTDAASFNINGNTLRAGVVFNYSTKSSYSIIIRATASVGPGYTDLPLTISIIDQLSDNPVEVSTSSTLLANGKVVYRNSTTNPKLGLVTHSGNPLPTGSVVIFQNKKFVKIDGDQYSYFEVPNVARPEWNWPQSAIDAWAVLQAL